MEKVIDYTTKGTCSRAIHIVLEDDKVKEVQYMGGCSGNTQGVAALVAGMKITDAIARLRGIRCGMKNTSCPDQLAIALENALKAD